MVFRSAIFLALAVAVVGPVAQAAETAPADPFRCVSPLSPAETKGVVSKIQDRYQGVKTVSGGFIQRSFFAGLEREEESRGSVAFKKPGMMDWHYEFPEEQRFVSDGTTLWFYEPELKKVTTAPFSNSFDSDLPVSFLLGVGELSKSFSLVSACHANDGVVADFRPVQSEKSLQNFSLLVAAETFQVRGARMKDTGGNVNTILLIKPETNTPLATERFSFVIPQGTDIFSETAR